MIPGLRRESGPENVDILHRCDDFVAIDKPYDVKINVNTAEEKTVETILVNMGVECHTQKNNKKLEHTYHWIHRLDYATSGVLLVGLSKLGSRAGYAAFSKRLARKQYIALVRGHVNLQQVAKANTKVQLKVHNNGLQYINVSADIIRDRTTNFPFIFTTTDKDLHHCGTTSRQQNNLSSDDNVTASVTERADTTASFRGDEQLLATRVVSMTSPVFSNSNIDPSDLSSTESQDNCKDNNVTGNVADEEFDDAPQSAETSICVLETGRYAGGKASKLLLQPHTGRSHQLRVHCKYIGHIIVGDYTYSLRQDGDTYRMMLHAYRLSLPLKPCIDHLDMQAPDPFISDELWESEQVHSSRENIPDLV